jgi:hypothetical protein
MANHYKTMKRAVSHPIPFGAQVISHFTSTLETANRSLADHFVGCAKFGTFWSIAPVDTPQDRLTQFRRGNLLPAGNRYSLPGFLITEVENCAFEFASLIKRKSVQIKMPRLFLHEPYLTTSDNSTIAKELTELNFGLFKIAKIKSVPIKSIKENIAKFTVSWHALFMVASRMDYQSAQQLISSSEIIGVGAYDGESYLYWLRTTLQ